MSLLSVASSIANIGDKSPVLGSLIKASPFNIFGKALKKAAEKEKAEKAEKAEKQQEAKDLAAFEARIRREALDSWS